MKVISFAFTGLTIVCLALLAKLPFNAIDKSNLEAPEKNRVKIRVFASFVLWSSFVSVWSVSGKMGDLKMFPLNMVPVLIVPMIGVLYFTFCKIDSAHHCQSLTNQHHCPTILSCCCRDIVVALICVE